MTSHNDNLWINTECHYVQNSTCFSDSLCIHQDENTLLHHLIQWTWWWFLQHMPLKVLVNKIQFFIHNLCHTFCGPQLGYTDANASLVAFCGNDAIFNISLTKPIQLTFQESTKPLTGNRTRCSIRTDGKSENNLNRSPILSSSTIIW